MTNDQGRYTLPGNQPTDEDLRMEVELTRKELGGTLASLMYKVDVPARTREVVHAKLDEARNLARRYPAVVGGTVAGLSVVIAFWLSLRR
jgi:hypothetical protein